MCDMINRDKIKVVGCRDFGREFENLCILLSDYEDIDCDDYDSQLESPIKNKSFSFSDDKHEYWEIE